jgi:hypothetical protein
MDLESRVFDVRGMAGCAREPEKQYKNVGRDCDRCRVLGMFPRILSLRHRNKVGHILTFTCSLPLCDGEPCAIAHAGLSSLPRLDPAFRIVDLLDCRLHLVGHIWEGV